MIVVDSSGWLEFFTDGQLADEYAKRLRNLASVVDFEGPPDAY